jgi:hypothetical protein
VQRGLGSRGYRPGPLVIDPRCGVNSEHSVAVLQNWMRMAVDDDAPFGAIPDRVRWHDPRV